MTTLKDIAHLAGVSTATVSRVMNGKGEASPQTIQKIQKIIQQVNYHPNRTAKMLSAQKSNLIALLIPNLRNPFFSELVQQIEQAANRQGYQIYLCNSEDNRQKVEYYLETMQDNYVAGAIIDSLFVEQMDLDQLEQRHIPTVTIDRTHLKHPYAALNVDHLQGEYLATKSILQHQKQAQLVFLSGPVGEQSSQDRYQGYLKAIQEFGATSLGILYGDFTYESGYQQMTQFLQQHTDLQGVVCSNDAMAVGALRACQDHQLRIPQDLQLVGYDNTRLGKFTNPRLSTVQQFGINYFDLIIDELTKQQKQQYWLTPQFIARESTYGGKND
ncbi:LacI family DNA-binding transcriptional regulator [Bombilactobacillus thymidiniphilus]|uniref:LacI family transcriptional regulator n=1 Tax=Bombilactobacillus thymidiniphilus TaxID=2923363 RepID=A0ABY4PF02_9LACO|nr:LacI family DNA-binding transcriptional regulator [Bombilactobacillus thymidiniphilus]UQS84150.1 LacI family transcriptional regulator [Bombilactobacillus thymidiniphilus]